MTAPPTLTAYPLVQLRAWYNGGMPHIVEVDQSIRLDDTRQASIFALANDLKKAILISAKVKRECLLRLRARGKRGNTLYIDLFAAAVWLLLEEEVIHLSRIDIDTEFSGEQQHAHIKERLLHYAQKAGKVLNAEQITFREITKHSPAHRLAYAVHQRKLPPARRIKARELLALVK